MSGESSQCRTTSEFFGSLPAHFDHEVSKELIKQVNDLFFLVFFEVDEASVVSIQETEFLYRHIVPIPFQVTIQALGKRAHKLITQGDLMSKKKKRVRREELSETPTIPDLQQQHELDQHQHQQEQNLQLQKEQAKLKRSSLTTSTSASRIQQTFWHGLKGPKIDQKLIDENGKVVYTQAWLDFLALIKRDELDLDPIEFKKLFESSLRNSNRKNAIPIAMGLEGNIYRIAFEIPGRTRNMTYNYETTTQTILSIRGEKYPPPFTFSKEIESGEFDRSVVVPSIVNTKELCYDPKWFNGYFVFEFTTIQSEKTSIAVENLGDFKDL